MTFSGIGFDSKNVTVNELSSHNVVELTPKKYEFETVEIVANKFEPDDVLLGVKNKNRGSSIGFGSPQLGTEIGAPIKIEKQSFLKSANFVFNHAKTWRIPFRKFKAFPIIVETVIGEIGDFLLEKLFV